MEPCCFEISVNINWEVFCSVVVGVPGWLYSFKKSSKFEGGCCETVLVRTEGTIGVWIRGVSRSEVGGVVNIFLLSGSHALLPFYPRSFTCRIFLTRAVQFRKKFQKILSLFFEQTIMFDFYKKFVKYIDPIKNAQFLLLVFDAPDLW